MIQHRWLHTSELSRSADAPPLPDEPPPLPEGPPPLPEGLPEATIFHDFVRLQIPKIMGFLIVEGLDETPMFAKFCSHHDSFISHLHCNLLVVFREADLEATSNLSGSGHLAKI